MHVCVPDGNHALFYSTFDAVLEAAFVRHTAAAPREQTRIAEKKKEKKKNQKRLRREHKVAAKVRVCYGVGGTRIFFVVQKCLRLVRSEVATA